MGYQGIGPSSAKNARLVIYTAAPGSRVAQALRLLAVVGTQDLMPDSVP